MTRMYLITAIFLLLGNASPTAQDFGRLLEAVDKLEARLHAELQAETHAREQAISDLTSQIRSGNAQDTLSSEPPSWQALDKRLTSLRSEIESMIQQAAATMSANDATTAQLLSEVEYLKAECRYLRGVLEETPRQLASLEPIATPPQSVEQGAVLMSPSLEVSDPADSEELVISGFVDASHYYDDAGRQASFSLDQFELDVNRAFHRRASLQADVEFVSDGSGGFDLDLEQGFLTYCPGGDRGPALTFGKFNAPIGFELLDAPDMYQYSHALVFNLGLPTNVTGLLLTSQLAGSIDAKVYLVNGWDVTPDNNKSKTIGLRLGITPDAGFNTGLSALVGPERDVDNSSIRSVFDCDMTYKPTVRWTLGSEFNYGSETKALEPNGDGHWLGWLVMANWKPVDRYGVTVRFDYFNDRHGLRTGTPQKLKAILFSPSVALSDELTGLLETRCDWSDQSTFADPDGGSKKRQLSLAFEFTYGF